MDEKTNAGLYVWTLFYLKTIRCCFLLAYLKQPTHTHPHLRRNAGQSDKQKLSKYGPYVRIYF